MLLSFLNRVAILTKNTEIRKVKYRVKVNQEVNDQVQF